MNVRCTVNDPEAACEMVAQGIGVGAIPGFLARQLIAHIAQQSSSTIPQTH